MLLRQAQAANPATANAEDQVRIQSLEAQLNDATQQLRQLRAERGPNAPDGQMLFSSPRPMNSWKPYVLQIKQHTRLSRNWPPSVTAHGRPVCSYGWRH